VLTSRTFITVDSAGEDSKPHFRHERGFERTPCKRLHNTPRARAMTQNLSQMFHKKYALFSKLLVGYPFAAL
jgi:hypothetical protein